MATGLLALSLAGCAGTTPPVSASRTAPSAAPAGQAAPAAAPVINEADYQSWKTKFRDVAISQGIRPEVYDAALAGIEPDPSILAADSAQPEFTRPIWDYLDRTVSPDRIATGRQLIEANKALLDRIGQRYGVDRYTLAAIWGIESGFGRVMGSKSVVRSLASLSYQGRRMAYGQSQLIAALEILQHGDVTRDGLVGSWAGAMGQTQFIPVTYNRYAVDFDGDGRRDVWQSTADALASTANYLKMSGWEAGARWGYEVSLPKGFDYAQADPASRRSVREWAAMGVRRVNGDGFGPAEQDAPAAILLPAGYRGPAFMVMNNYRMILTYNNSTSYGLAVSLLADAMRGRPGVMASWPRDDRPLSLSERISLQTLLASKGYNPGQPDGILGANTRKAVRAYQQSIGLPADGYADSDLLTRIRQ
ncbi:MAG: lytic murein transglycosylase [Parvibaculaceae bacterium]|nr:lytic murein transglycosylase [Parvibaculaceae bacterium]